jgi:hypothetical protein
VDASLSTRTHQSSSSTVPQAGHETVRTLRALGRLAEAKAAERRAKELRR